MTTPSLPSPPPAEFPSPARLIKTALQKWHDEHPIPGEYDQWLSTCPQCKDTLHLESYRLSATGHLVEGNGVHLRTDGFPVNAPFDLRDQSTEEEIVYCPRCGFRTALENLSLFPFPTDEP